VQERVKHLELIQDVIVRMAGNSALLKGWSITLASALIGWAASEHSHVKYVVIGFFPPIFFAVLDAYYLRQERLFRRLYDCVRLQDDAQWLEDPFTMDTSTVADQVQSWFRTVFATVVFWPHFLVMLMVAGILVLWVYVLTTL